jgi:hypothetical protein
MANDPAGSTWSSGELDGGAGDREQEETRRTANVTFRAFFI